MFKLFSIVLSTMPSISTVVYGWEEKRPVQLRDARTQVQQSAVSKIISETGNVDFPTALPCSICIVAR